MPPLVPPDRGAGQGYLEWRRKAEKSAMDYCFHMYNAIDIISPHMYTSLAFNNKLRKKGKKKINKKDKKTRGK